MCKPLLFCSGKFTLEHANKKEDILTAFPKFLQPAPTIMQNSFEPLQIFIRMLATGSTESRQLEFAPLQRCVKKYQTPDRQPSSLLTVCFNTV